MGRKKEEEEFGMLLTREMLAMMSDDRLSFEQRVNIFNSIVFDKKLEDVLMSSFADSLRTGYKRINETRKAQIISHRERQRERQRNIRKLSAIASNSEQCQTIADNAPQFLCKAKQSKAKHNIPPKSPRGDCGDEPPTITPEEILADKPVADTSTQERREMAVKLAAEIEQTEAFSRMRVNTAKLVRTLVSVLKKNAGADIMAGLAIWTERWKADDWRFAPGRITDWLIDGKYLEEPRQKEAPVDNYRDVGDLENI